VFVGLRQWLWRERWDLLRTKHVEVYDYKGVTVEKIHQWESNS